jgi:hypothetical protein
MTKVSKQTNIIFIIKLAILSLIFCLPKAPAGIERDTSVFSSLSQSKVHSFLLPSNGHFEYKVLKKIPLIESVIPDTAIRLTPQLIALNNSIPTYGFSRTDHFIISSFARGPPIHS